MAQVKTITFPDLVGQFLRIHFLHGLDQPAHLIEAVPFQILRFDLEGSPLCININTDFKKGFA